MQKLQIGAPYRFTPTAFSGEAVGRPPGRQEIPRVVTGRIVYINRPHRFFTVVFVVNGVGLKESIKF